MTLIELVGELKKWQEHCLICMNCGDCKYHSLCYQPEMSDVDPQTTFDIVFNEIDKEVEL